MAKEEELVSLGSLPPMGEEGGEDYRSISSSRGVASPAMDMGVLSIMGLGEGRGVSRCFCFARRSASLFWSHCSAILPQSIAVWLLLDFGCCLCPELEEGWDGGWDWVDWGVVLA